MRAVLVLLCLASATAVAAPDRKDDRKSRKAERIAKADKPDKSDKSDKSDKGTRSKKDKPDADKSDKAARSDKKDKPDPEPAAPRTPGPDDPKATAALGKIVAGPDAAARQAAIDELATVAPMTLDALGEWVARPHETDQATRRAVLAEIKAAVPDKSGKFPVPERKTGKELAADDEVDWQKALLALPAGTPGLGEVIADVAAIRALSGTKDVRAARVLFGIAFGEDSIIYRDEVGRYLRKMEPYSVPALTRESLRAKDPDRRRYATWQLERLDRQDPLKALAAAAGDEALMVAVLDVFRETKHREAVHAVWTKVDDDSPRIRAAARAAWMDYITGPPPPPAPRKKLQLPGGKLTKKEKPLWLTYRELADNELRQSANDLLGEDYPLEDETSLDDKEVNVKKVKVNLEEVTKRLFDHFDAERAKKQGAQWAEAKAKADAGDLAGAVAALDRLIATNADRAERVEMSKVYAQWAKQLEGKQQWAEASAAYSKAHGLDPKGADAPALLAAHHYALGKSLESQGKDGGPDFRRAAALKPDYTPARTAAARSAEPSGRPTWMLFAAVGAALVALALFGIAMLRRRPA